MDVSLDIRPFICALYSLIHEGQIIVDYHIDLQNIDTAGNDICGD